jgi:DNA-binding Lrp family transcriptional regulator
MSGVLKVDEKDKLILFELLQDCRQPLSKIAKAVKLPQQTVSYRIKKLEDSKIIKKYTTNINYAKLGLSRHSLYLDVKGVAASDVNKYLKEIEDIHEISCCYMLHDMSEWKLYISVWTETIERYDDIQTKVLSKFKTKIRNYLSFQSVRSYTYLARVLNPKKKFKIDEKGNPECQTISEIDWKLIKLLKKNSKISIMELAEKLNLTAVSVTRKINTLKKKEIIQRFYPIINLNELGYKEYTFISRIDPSYSKELKKFMEYTKKDPRFIIAIRAVGYVNLYYAFLVKNHDELKEVRSNIEEILGESILQTYKVEVDDMIS